MKHSSEETVHTNVRTLLTETQFSAITPIIIYTCISSQASYTNTMQYEVRSPNRINPGR
jgi:hypothetical protein